MRRPLRDDERHTKPAMFDFVDPVAAQALPMAEINLSRLRKVLER